MEHGVVSLTVQGLFPVVPPFLPNGPRLVLCADGRLFIHEHAPDGGVVPIVWPYRLGVVRPGTVEHLLAVADRAGLRSSAPAYAPPMGMSDPPRTTLVLAGAAHGTAVRHVVDGLHAGEHDPDRAAVHRFVDELDEIARTAPSSPYRPDRIELVATRVPDGAPSLGWSGGLDLDASADPIVTDDSELVSLLTSLGRGTVLRQRGHDHAIAARVVLPVDGP